MDDCSDGEAAETSPIRMRVGMRGSARWRWRRVVIVAAMLLATLPSIAAGSTSSSASGDAVSTIDEDDEVACVDARCATLHRATLACVPAGATAPVCGQCLPGFVDGCAGKAHATDAPLMACQIAPDGGESLRYGEAEDDDDSDEHHGMGIQGALGTAMGSVAVGLMCLVTWRGWLDCCSRAKRRAKNRAYMTATTKQWRCAICLHENSGLRSYCVLCKTEMQRPQEDRQTVSITINADNTDNGDAYALAETPRGNATLVSERFTSPTDEQLSAVERLEWKRSVSKDGSMQWKRYHAGDVRRHTRLQGTFVQAEECLARSVANKSDSTPCDSSAGFFIPLVVQAVTTWAPVDAATQHQMYKQWRKLPSIAALPFDSRLRWLCQEFLRLRQNVGDKYTIHVHRDHILKQTMHFFQSAPPSTLRRQFRVDFSNEPGVDGGGILREWLHLVCKELFSESLGLFNQVESSLDIGYWIRRSETGVKRSQSELQMFKFFGMLLAKALLEGLVLNVRLSVPLLKHLLGYPLSREDLRFLDEHIYSSTTFILENDNVDQLCLTFNVAGQDLISNGAQIPVTDQNKHQYVDHVVRHYLFDSVEDELRSIVEGFRRIVPDKLLHVFDFKELDLVFSGLAEIDVLDWRAHTTVGVLGHDKEEEQSVIDWFWEIVEAMDQRERSRLVQYVTGSSGVPVDGFAALTSTDGRLQPFTIQLVAVASTPCLVLPYASTCYNRLDLPVFKEKQELQQMLNMVVNMDVTGFNRR